MKHFERIEEELKYVWIKLIEFQFPEEVFVRLENSSKELHFQLNFSEFEFLKRFQWIEFDNVEVLLQYPLIFDRIK